MFIIETRLSPAKLKSLEEDFETYQNIQHEIVFRGTELEFPWRESDDNVGGSSGNRIYKLQESILIRKDVDDKLKRLFRLKNECDRAIAEFNDKQLEIYKLKFCTGDYLDWNTVGEMLNPPLSHTTIYKKRYKMLEILAKKQGLI